MISNKSSFVATYKNTATAKLRMWLQTKYTLHNTRCTTHANTYTHLLRVDWNVRAWQGWYLGAWYVIRRDLGSLGNARVRTRTVFSIQGTFLGAGVRGLVIGCIVYIT